MGDLLLKGATIVMMTHGLRALVGRLGPRRGGLLMGLPSTTAITLYFLGREQGPEFAAAAAGSALLGLTGAVAAALVYATAAVERRRPAVALTLAIAAYFVPAMALRHARLDGLGEPILVSVAAISAAVLATRALRVDASQTQVPRAPSRIRSMVLRTVIPAAFLLGITGMARALGPKQAGLLGTFPATFLVVTAVTHLEVGPGLASRTATAFLPGNLAMVAFLAILRAGCREWGLEASMLLGYTAALATLVLIERSERDLRMSKSPAREIVSPGRATSQERQCLNRYRCLSDGSAT